MIPVTAARRRNDLVRHGDGPQKLAENLLGADGVPFVEVTSADHAMRAHRDEHRLDVVGDHVVPAMEQCTSLGGADKRERATRRHTHLKMFMIAGHLHQIQRVIHQNIIEANMNDAFLNRLEIVAVHDRRE